MHTCEIRIEYREPKSSCKRRESVFLQELLLDYSGKCDQRNSLVKDNKWFNPIKEKIDFINKKENRIRLKCQK